MIEKQCANCKHKYVFSDEEPCKECFDGYGFMKWEGTEDGDGKKQNS